MIWGPHGVKIDPHILPSFLPYQVINLAWGNCTGLMLTTPDASHAQRLSWCQKYSTISPRSDFPRSTFPRSTTVSMELYHFTGSPRISFQHPPWPEETIKEYPRSTKVHHHLCGIQTFHRFTKNFLPIQDPPWPKETIEVYSKVHQGPPPSLWDTTISQVHQEFPSKVHPGPRKS